MIKEISVLKIIEGTSVDGTGFRTSIYAAGCGFRCKGCHNPQSWDLANGTWQSVEDLLSIVIRNKFDDVTFSGGDPLFQVEGFSLLAKKIKAETGKNIWCYTGYTFEKIMQNPNLAQILPYIDVLVDGNFILKLKNEDSPFRGSENQRLINVPESLKRGEVIVLELDNEI
ncbi:anaerobic ribonucleoside-triphosphate reductase activating protein [Ornithobacterium rhinotracheale]|uniref:anaerobic ribonucleoside-triphosphate reductase activating protein n=1 Tax=Ornithobacterium rhinotracheale TaxID=28251 RepID=UPI00129C22D6|nr:anaerobic ribonucleoside-triphosphate reductase activating protein [Ornithobacterium rhinotracheale]MRJ10623.1 anaerobic ribonucleoside-triphosphate reductase activating protein [Ornithobacterium rhinotracheale]